MTLSILHRSRGAAAGALAAAALVGHALSGPATAAAPEELPDLVEEVSPAVVTVTTVDIQSGSANPFPEGTPFREFFRRFAPEGMPDGGEGEERARRGVGSGFVYDSDGLIVTNNHVVDGAERVEIRFNDGETMTAEVLGTDPETDLALLRVEADGLPSVPLGDSDAVRVGENVAAVGNPFGLSTTVTSGIISAAGRAMPGGNYVEFLQTDAAINRGNSGGPLFNMEGEVVGVNASIFSPTGGNVGIGFAVPSNIVKEVVTDLLDDGKVQRGWLGVAIQPVTPEIADAMELDGTRGALVANVSDGSPSDGVLRQGDVILEFAGKPVESSRDLPFLVGRTDPGTEVEMVVLREGDRETLSLTLGELDRDRRASRGDMEQGQSEKTASLGAELAPLTRNARARLELDRDVEGAVITDLDPDGQAARAGLRPGDVIERVGRTEVASPRDVARAIEQLGGDSALFLVNRGGNRIFVGVPLAS